MAGTNINSLKVARKLPTSTPSYHKYAEKDIADFKTMRYRTIVDVGGMRENAVITFKNKSNNET